MKESMNAPAGLTVFAAQELSKTSQDHDLVHVPMAGKPIWDQLWLPGFLTLISRLSDSQ